MKPAFIHQFLSFSIICAIFIPAKYVVGYRSYLERCIANPGDLTNSCDPYRFLECYSDNLCHCAFTGSTASQLIWNPRFDRCTFRVGDTCLNTYNGFIDQIDVRGGGQGGNVDRCPPHSYCSQAGGSRNICTCHNGYYPNYDYTECTNNSAAKKNISIGILISSILLFCVNSFIIKS